MEQFSQTGRDWAQGHTKNASLETFAANVLESKKCTEGWLSTHGLSHDQTEQIGYSFCNVNSVLFSLLFLPLKKPHTVGVKRLGIRSVIGWCMGNYWRRADRGPSSLVRSNGPLLAGRGTNDGEADGEESEHEGQGNGSTRLRRQRTQNESDLGVIDMVDLCPYRWLKSTSLLFHCKGPKPACVHTSASPCFTKMLTKNFALGKAIHMNFHCEFAADNFPTSSPVPARFRKSSRILVCKLSLLANYPPALLSKTFHCFGKVMG